MKMCSVCGRICDSVSECEDGCESGCRDECKGSMSFMCVVGWLKNKW